MTRGLSETQKTILKVIIEMPEGSRADRTSDKLKAVLYPVKTPTFLGPELISLILLIVVTRKLVL
jgi:hypothetical protein